jgi:hypothetical protein
MDSMAEAEKTSIDTAEERRQFLKKLGRFAAVTPPAVTLLLSVLEKPANATVLSPFVL